MQTNEQSPVLEVRHLSKSLSRRPILNDLSFSVYPGEIFGFLGPNGSGKTTTIKLMLGLLRIDAGEIRILGHNVVTEHEKAFASVGGIIENPELYPYLTGYENLDLFRRMYDDVPKSRIDEVVELVGLQARIKDKVSKYSLGMRQRLGVAQALLCKPRLLVLDEPTNGLDPGGIHDLRDLLKRLCREENVAVFISSHLLSEIEQMCDRVAVIDKGTLIGIHSIEEMHRVSGATDGRLCYLFRTAEGERFAAILAENGYKGEVLADGVTLMLLPTETGSILTLAVQNGIMLLGFEEQKRTLEDAFLELTRTGRTTGGVAHPVGVSANDTACSAETSLGDEIHADWKTDRTKVEQEDVYVPPSERVEKSTDESDGAATTEKTSEADDDTREGDAL